MLDASIDGHKNNVSTMIRLLEEISTPSRVSALSKAIAFLDRNGYDWNNRYVATTVPGQTYEGSFVSAGGDDFMLIQQPNRIIIGHTSDLPKLAQSGKPIAFTAY